MVLGGEVGAGAEKGQATGGQPHGCVGEGHGPVLLLQGGRVNSGGGPWAQQETRPDWSWDALFKWSEGASVELEVDLDGLWARIALERIEE